MLNPILFTERVVQDFLRYQLTAYPFADKSLYAQMRTLLSLDESRRSPLMKGPFVSLSRTFEQGIAVKDTVTEGWLHPHLQQLVGHPHLYGHQEQAIRAIVGGKTTLVSTGTGSGKTECFLYPIISRCLQLRDRNAPPGISAVIVYPMNALADDQMDRLRELLVGTGIRFGIYTGNLKERREDAMGHQMPAGTSLEDFRKRLAKERSKPDGRDRQVIHPPEENICREEMRDPRLRPRILLTNVKQLELLLTRRKDIEMFDGASLDFLVFDEAHTFRGALGAETACLIRRLRSYCGKSPTDTVCVATSATIVDAKSGDSRKAGAEFASRFFGVDPDAVELVGERYQPDVWAPAQERRLPPAFNGYPADHLAYVLSAVEKNEEEAGHDISSLLKFALGIKLQEKSWRLNLYHELNRNELLFQLVELLRGAKKLETLATELSAKINRTVSEHEVLLWLALGAAARNEERPLVRPVIHTFVRGMGGAVVTFPPPQSSPILHLSAESVEEIPSLGCKPKALPVLTCTTCGQHYFEHWANDFILTDQEPRGGQAADGGGRFWMPCDRENDGRRVVLLDRLIAQPDDDMSAPERTSPLWFCRICGCLHEDQPSNCRSCGRPNLLTLVNALPTRPDGRINSCHCCRKRGASPGGRFREPIRPVRAVTVSDVHVLAQNMLQHAERKRLLIFADNRQDAAFQAGWMQDHSRRYRLRALIYQRLKIGPVSLGDLVAWLDELLDKDESLSHAVAPEVWRAHRKQGAMVEHLKARKFFLRAQVLRELTVAMKQRIGLEPWGRMLVRYQTLHESQGFFQRWGQELGLTPEELLHGVELLLDRERRNSHLLLDREGHIFTRFWKEGLREIQLGFLPLLPDVPMGLVLRRTNNHHQQRVRQWMGRGNSIISQTARKWGVADNRTVTFVEELWSHLTEEARILAETNLLGSDGQRVLNGGNSVFQIDADLLLIEASAKRGFYRCRTCRQSTTKAPPRMLCLGWNCDGLVEWEDEKPDDYDLQVLDGTFTMLRPREHSAQVPQADRTAAEQYFKGAGETVNCLVCTPTLELGVDIGQLDSVLMRNVPPLPANYFQRAGRAGRRHRMAVNLTYARPASHDKAFFDTPEKLLNGVVLPPKFNLHNDILVARHANATLLTTLFAMAAGKTGETVSAQQEIGDVLKDTFPFQIGPFFFDATGNLLSSPRSVATFGHLVGKHRKSLVGALQRAFLQGWPEADKSLVETSRLGELVDAAFPSLQRIIEKIWNRLKWHLRQMERFRETEENKGALSDEENAFRERCRRFINRIKNGAPQNRRSGEGFDDTNIYTVLAAEGWLPGYGLETGSVNGAALRSISSMSRDDFDLPRPTAMAVREYVPGNLIYANGERYTPRIYRLPPEAPLVFRVDAVRQSVQEIEQAGGALGSTVIKAMPICDVEMPHISHISDEEEFRFQMPVMILGLEQRCHDGGKAYRWGTTPLFHRHNVHMRLVNVGPSDRVSEGNLGYPVCLVSGQSRSPYASQSELDNFRDTQLERCGKAPETSLGFYADVVAEGIKFSGLPDQTTAYSLGEVIRLAGSVVLDMEPDDLQLLVIPQVADELVDLTIFDPMPGGSGLLKQLIENWPTLVAEAHRLASTCPSACSTSCPDCLQRFRNSFYHKHLDRHIAVDFLEAAGGEVSFTHDLPPDLPSVRGVDAELPVNTAEALLLELIRKAGLREPECQKSLPLPHPFVSTRPDFYYEDPKETYEGICIYLDGLSKHIHGNAETKARDDDLRKTLENKNYKVFSLPATHLHDPDAMADFLYRLARCLVKKETAEGIRNSRSWWGTTPES